VSDYDNLPPSKPRPRRPPNDPVFCVGWHAFVNWPQSQAQNGQPVPMMDDDGRPMGNDLADGDEVEILAWRPKSRQGSLYQILRLTDGTQWWLAAIHLRRQRAANGRRDAATL
jgi:hypothetical protein